MWCVSVYVGLVVIEMLVKITSQLGLGKKKRKTLD